MVVDELSGEDENENNKSFWKWYFTYKRNWLFGILFNSFTLIGIYLMTLDPPDKTFFGLICIPITLLWFMTIREYRELKNKISK